MRISEDSRLAAERIAESYGFCCNVLRQKNSVLFFIELFKPRDTSYSAWMTSDDDTREADQKHRVIALLSTTEVAKSEGL